MTLKTPILSLPNTAQTGSQSACWKIGQIAQGRVANSNPTNLSVNIAGSRYQVTSNLQFVRGESLLLKVSGVSPQLEFSIVSRAPQNVGNRDSVPAILTDKFLRSSAAANRNINTSLTTLISLLHASSSFPVPPATALLIDSMRSRLIREGGLLDPKQIQNSLQSNSLLISRPSDSKVQDAGLLSLLRQIADSLESQRNPGLRAPAGVKYEQALGMSLYLGSDVNYLATFTREVEEQYTNLLNLRNRGQEELQQHAYRLLAELPVMFRNQVRSVSIRFLEKEAGEKKGLFEADCGVDFEFEYGSGKIFTRILIASSLVRFSVGCAQDSTAAHLITSKNSLGDRLSNYGLKLIGLTVAVHNDYLSLETNSAYINEQSEVKRMEELVPPFSGERTGEATRIQLRDTYAEGKMPKLEEFALRIRNQDVEVTREIPEQLYCAMACFFSQLFEEEID